MVTLVNLRAYWRFFVVMRRFSPLIVAYWRDRKRYFLFGGGREVDAETQRERAAILLDILLTLGPTFIKLGQILSTRPDILPPAYIDVLEGLQDDVPPAPWEESKIVLEDELGPVDETFDDFDREPISGASLGQVYTARYEGSDVAVKVRRPKIESLVEADLRTIRWSIPLVRKFTGSGRAFSLENLADEFAKTIREEMDYNRERAMLEEIRANFADEDRIRIPTAFEAVSGPRVLTMEYIPGTKISDVDALDDAGHDRNAIAETLQDVYLQMIIDDGVFHADPHPGNLAVDDDGAVIFYDFGMAGRVDPFIQEKIVDFYVAVARQDIDGILDTLIAMGTLSPEADREVMGNVMELAIADASGEDIEQYQVNQIIEQVESTIYEFPLRLPPDLALVLRVATVVEGVCVTLDPEFDFISTATEYLKEEGYYEQTARNLAEGAGQQAQKTAEALFTVPPKADDFLDRANRGDLHIDVTIDDGSNVLDKLAMRIAYSVLLAVGVLSSTILYSFAQSWRLAAVVLLLAAPLAVALYRSFRKKRGIRTTPQFTRQGMKKRRDD
ncbi:ABC1 kinase family protein [Halorubrum lacusprofundi]|uniref:ABC-1 domain protein n=1 Tax=Halorubrum lacusprofundi (strain ATCC 49239 / DSM 5036 / JCM 8891 / ACAM 34) TaxID=416348 RepID=B9LSL0_HALLT|nr:AarF/ABC1/UbiB kinase family protein [Halorubrum lacusprofundi]ACM57957.1 ABC-1 domain protein [Halorubrum lacusprofundi ATCC 49239]MCG1006890.1 AarF/ABC1/UbiB kinase family protein [Halorubrum lacusprofundi]